MILYISWLAKGEDWAVTHLSRSGIFSDINVYGFDATPLVDDRFDWPSYLQLANSLAAALEEHCSKDMVRCSSKCHMYLQLINNGLACRVQ